MNNMLEKVNTKTLIYYKSSSSVAKRMTQYFQHATLIVERV